MKILPVLALLALAGCMSEAPVPAAPPAAAAQPLRPPDVRYAPSPHRVVDVMLRLARVRSGDVVYDLGSGDGRIPIAAARDFGARGVGIDIDPVRIAEAQANARHAGVTDRVVFRNEDLFEADFRDATVVTLFLQRHLNLRLRPRLLAELAPGTRIVSYWHDMGDWQPERRVQAGDAWVYLWTVPAR
ncbi:MAG TPA: methyltransferase domain-containing protein [Allosphingosinicella sp.]|nr:methyltransferase domain-containing protein [Allosphingosinicella sp.]